MISYLLNFLLCSGVLLLLYSLLLERERMHRFNRFYLLASLVFSLTVPAISIETGPEFIPNTVDAVVFIGNARGIPSQIIAHDAENGGLPANAITILYGLTTLLLGLRFGRNLYKICHRRFKGKIVDLKKNKIVLLPGNEVTYTFLNWIFVDERAYHLNQLEAKILTHEMEHVRQRHTVDVLFIELLRVFFWFNPFLFFYKKAMQLNHEFLADEAVLKEFPDLIAYQRLLLHCVAQKRQNQLTSSFNYSITKKRFTMMTTNTSSQVAMVKKLVLIPILAGMAFLFTDRVQAQQPTAPANQAEKTAASPGDGVSQKHFDEYQAIAKSLIKVKVGKDGKEFKIYEWGTDAQRKKLDVIYRSMSDTQKATAIKLSSIPFRPAPAKKSPTQEQLTAWLDSKEYGVWLDDKRISNAELKKYRPSDFDYYYVSKLEKNAINYGKHYFQIGVMTPEAFAKWRETYIPLESIPE